MLFVSSCDVYLLSYLPWKNSQREVVKCEKIRVELAGSLRDKGNLQLTYKEVTTVHSKHGRKLSYYRLPAVKQTRWSGVFKRPTVAGAVLRRASSINK